MRRTLFLLGVLMAAGSAHAAITVTNNNSNAAFAAALSGGGSGITINTLNIQGQSSGAAMSTGLFSVTGPNAYNLGGTGIVMSTGDAAAYSSGPNTSGSTSTNYGSFATPAQNALLQPITTFTDHRDVTQIDVTFTPDVGVTTLGFDMVFGSEEYAEYVGTIFNDGFGIYVNGVNYAQHLAQRISINNTAMGVLAETELDGVIVTNNGAVFQFLTPVNPGVNTLTFIIGDSSDHVLDTTVYIQNFGVPAPGAAITLGSVGLVAGLRRRRA
ncbi:MAG: choice-of-anchor L domain-containing protein [Phycisphaerales bacterium]